MATSQQPLPLPPSSNVNSNQAKQMGISAFKSLYQHGFARANRYRVSFNEGEVYPESITLPSKSVSVYTHTLFGPIIQYPYREIFNDNIVMTFPEDSFGSIRYNFESWMAGLSVAGKAIPSAIMTKHNTFTIDQLDYADNIIGTYFVQGAYPISIVPTNMGYAMNNETAKVQVMIKYYRYEYA
tara:strand:+ start:4342 stop:4890 length:549 start_codon:yes stop_codon:yes gene_type:complete